MKSEEFATAAGSAAGGQCFDLDAAEKEYYGANGAYEAYRAYKANESYGPYGADGVGDTAGGAAAEASPVIGITANYVDGEARLADGYYRQVVRAGGTPVVLPPLSDESALRAWLDRLDGVVLSGGADINPLYAGEEPETGLGTINAERDLPELLLARLAANRQMPILGICRGIQTLAMALGGRIHQDISTIARVKHSQQARRDTPTHTVHIAPDTLLARIFAPDAGSVSSTAPTAGSQPIPATGLQPVAANMPSDSQPVASYDSQPTATNSHPSAVANSSLFTLHSSLNHSSLKVNSFHHQAVDAPGPHLRVVATATDGIIEAVESSEQRPVVGVQWHPECLGDDGLPLFRWLTDEARRYRATQRLHDSLLTLDTHCDTPMLFPRGVDFARRDPQLLVDLPKMEEGRLDATIMVCYLPQPHDGKTFAECTDFAIDSPKAYADFIFDRIESIAAANSHRLAIARSAEELWANKRAGRKSIVLGIENGLALEGCLENLTHFARRGVAYITLCHNGDNDICDSARGSATHGGLSAFGREVVREMNRLGIMVDLSHAAESSFYDALELSEVPIVCSHSSCRALCDHPRNLTDEQMRRLAAVGGVMQVTLYNGFLRTDGQATIDDAMYHLLHAIDVMGIDHVGLGTDFDGDGGVPGLADASQLTLFTRRLIDCGFSAEEIQKIWGGNFLRVMKQAQAIHNS